MVKETYIDILKEVKVNVTASEIDSVRKKNIKRTGCRVYDGKYIGVAGVLGDAGSEVMEQAQQGIAKNISYPYAPAENASRVRELGHGFEAEEFVAQCEGLMESLRTEFPDIVFGNVIKAVQTNDLITNDAGLSYRSGDTVYEVSLTVKRRQSNAVFDTALGIQTRGDFVNETLGAARMMLPALSKEALAPGKSCIFAVQEYYLYLLLLPQLSAEGLAKGASMLCSHFGKKAFSELLTLYADRSENVYGVPFFDAEGSVLEGDRIALIENGVIVRGYADKKRAALYSADNTASAEGTYDNVPDVGVSGASLKPGSDEYAKLAAGRDVIMIDMMEGGDCTNEGRFASPVQMAYLLKDGQPVGRLPEFGISFSIYDALGSGLIGVTKDLVNGGRMVFFRADVD